MGKTSLLVVALSVAAAWSEAAELRRVSRPVQDSYIVVLNEGVARPGSAPSWAGPPVESVAQEVVARYGGVLARVYEHALQGFNVRMSAALAAVVARDPRVAYVEEDGEVHLVETQPNATWGLDRIDQRNLPLSGTFGYTSTGAGVRAYIIDTGIRFSHTEFGGRALSGFDAVDGGSADDCNGHGTHVAGTVGGATYGVAKDVTLVAVRVLNCIGSGSTAGVISGVDWVTQDHASGSPAVANMSLGGGASTALDNAVTNSIADGVTYAVAAGNGNIFGIPQDACRYSPARVAAAFTISATNRNDARAYWANYGKCVKGFAPGVGITSAWHTSNTATNTISGTSMATPHVTGVAALYLQTNPGATPQDVGLALYTKSTKGKVTNARSVKNHLLFTDF
jgi:subtilisin family serine protease